MGAFQQVLNFVRDQIHDHWLKFVMGVGFMALGWLLGKRRARAEWKKKEFFSRLNVSLNVVQPGQPLLIRTLIEKSCEDIFLNKVAVESIIAAARTTNDRNPILVLPKDDYWYYLNAVLNEMAEKFAVGQLKRDLGLPVVSAQYLMCLTSETAGSLRTHKIRAMVIRKDLLTALPAERPPLEKPWHDARWETLKILAEQYKVNPDQFMEVELSV